MLRPILSMLVCLHAAVPAAADNAGAATSGDAVVGRIGTDAAITVADLEARIATARVEARRGFELQVHRATLAHERAQDRLAQAELERMLDERVLAKEAAARGKTELALLGEIPDPVVTDDQVRAFYVERQARIGQPYEQVATEIRQFLAEQQADLALRRFMDGLRQKYDARALREPLRADVAADGPQRGPAAAPVTIVEFADFQCPFCAQMKPVLNRIVQERPAQVRLVYRHLPIPQIHPGAVAAAEASLCAADQGKFWEFHDALYANPRDTAAEQLSAVAARVGLQRAAFDRCVAERTHADAVRADMAAAERLGLEGTPAYFVNGRLLNGTVSYEALVQVIDDELRLREHRASPRTAARADDAVR
jgi:protein-disulfide isomerase